MDEVVVRLVISCLALTSISKAAYYLEIQCVQIDNFATNSSVVTQEVSSDFVISFNFDFRYFAQFVTMKFE